MNTSVYKYPSLLLILFGWLLLPGCSTEFEPDINEKPVTVLNALLQPDSLIWADVSHSWYFNTEDNHENSILTDADVECSVNDGDWIAMTYNPDRKRYESQRRAAEGDRVRLRAFSRRYGEAEGYAEVPRRIPIDSWTFTTHVQVDLNSMTIINNEIYHPWRLDIRYRITFTDPAGEDNFYMFAINTPQGNWEMDDPIISENESMIDGVVNKYHYSTFFSDMTIPGKQYTLSAYTSHWINRYDRFEDEAGQRKPMIEKITLYAISRDYYMYLLSLFKKYTGMQGVLEDFGMADPRSVFSNVNPGVGIVSGSAPETFKHDVGGLLEEAYKQAYP